MEKVGRASGRVYVWVGWGLCTELNKLQLDMGELIDVEGQLMQSPVDQGDTDLDKTYN